MRKGTKMLIAARGRDGEGGRPERHDGRQMRYGNGNEGLNHDVDMRRGSGGYNRMGYAGEMRYDGDMRYDDNMPHNDGGMMRYGGDMRRGGSRERMRYDGGSGGRMEYDGMEGPMEEMRRRYRRYRDGRFAPKSRYYPPEYGGDDDDDGMEEMRHTGYPIHPLNNYPEQRRRGAMENRIGFNMGDDPKSGGTLTFPGHSMMRQEKHGRLDKETAESWVENMRNEDGTKGAHWTMDQTEQVRRQKNLDCDPVEFWVAMNAAYSDLCKVAKKHNVNTMDYYVDYVKAFWFGDQDAAPHKLAAYYEGVVKK